MTAHPEVETTGRSWSYNDFAGRNGSALRGRNHAAGQSGGLIETMNEAQRFLSALFKGHIGSVDPDAVKIPARRGALKMSSESIVPANSLVSAELERRFAGWVLDVMVGFVLSLLFTFIVARPIVIVLICPQGPGKS